MVQKTKTSATTTVMRSRFFSTTVEPIAADPMPPPNMSDRPPPLPLWSSTRKTITRAAATSAIGDEGDEHGLAGYQPIPAGREPRLDDFGGDFRKVAGHGVTLASVDQRRLFGRADVLRLPATGAEPAAARRVDRARHVALEHDPLALAFPLRVRMGYRRQQCLRVRMAGLVVQVVRRTPTSTSLPRYITATVSEMCCTTDRSCAMNRYARPRRSWRSSSRLTTPAWIETSSAETGSSSTSTRGRARARGRRRRADAAHRRTRAGTGSRDHGSARPGRAAPRLGLAIAGHLVDDERLRDRGADRHPRVERRVRILEDDLHLPPHARRSPLSSVVSSVPRT